MKVHLNNNEYLKASDIEYAMVLTIESITENETFNNYDIKFEEVDKLLSLNQTNLGFLMQQFGDETEKWVSMQVELFFDPAVVYKGKKVGGMRLREPKN